MNAQADYFEIDFLKIETRDSGDAITARYSLNGSTSIHVVDGGFQESGPDVVTHIKTYYGAGTIIDHVVATHPDGDHLGGLRTVLEEMSVRELWMLRPWLYAGEILSRFKNVSSLEYLVRALKEAYPNVLALEEIATRKKIPIRDPFQGAAIGAFRVLAPTKQRYLDLIVQSGRTPEAVGATAKSLFSEFRAGVAKAANAAVSLVKAAWGVEVFSSDDVSAENKMSVIQYAALCNTKILLTADGAVDSFSEAAAYAPYAGLTLPGIDRFQVPHHGSRRNVSTEMLDAWVGPRRQSQLPEGSELFQAYISSAKADPDHPRNAVRRAFIHRGAKVVATEGRTIRTQVNAPQRPGWVAIPGDAYPEEQEA